MQNIITQTRHTMQQGFTLVELAVVIIIIGLLAVGIVGGQSLIRAAELRSVISDVEDFSTNINIFEQQYLALPGDMQNADEFWNNTQSGNGDSIIDWDAAPNESLLAWQHLGLAGLAAGEFSGSGNGALIGVNTPASRAGGGYTLHDGAEVKEKYGVSNGMLMLKNYILLGNPSSGGKTDAPLFAPADAMNIDDKMDDANPDSGAVMARGTNCTLNDGQDVYYDINFETPECVLEFRLP